MSKPFATHSFPGASDLNDLVGVYDRPTSLIDVVSSLTETTIYTKSIGAGHMSTDRTLRLSLRGDYLNNSGGPRQPVIKVKLGATTLLTDTLSTVAASASRYPWRFDVEIDNLGATNSQWVNARLEMGVAGGGPRVSETLDGLLFATGAVDTTVAQTLVVTITLDTNSASHSWRRLKGVLELL